MSRKKLKAKVRRLKEERNQLRAEIERLKGERATDLIEKLAEQLPADSTINLSVPTKPAWQ